MDETTLLLIVVFFVPVGLLTLLQAAGDGPRST